MLDFEDKLSICYEQMALEYNITEKKARLIVRDFEIQELVVDYYAEAISDFEKEQMQRWEDEEEANPDLYRNDIHGGV